MIWRYPRGRAVAEALAVVLVRGCATNPLANPFMDRILAWIAREGSITTRVHYRIEGDRLVATNEIVIGRLELAQAGERDEVKRRLGLPLGLIVALMKDARVFARQLPDRPVPKAAEEMVSMLRDAEPEPDAEAPVPPGASGDGRVEFSITQ